MRCTGSACVRPADRGARGGGGGGGGRERTRKTHGTRARGLGGALSPSSNIASPRFQSLELGLGRDWSLQLRVV